MKSPEDLFEEIKIFGILAGVESKIIFKKFKCNRPLKTSHQLNIPFSTF
jgi:hypothetical protein